MTDLSSLIADQWQPIETAPKDGTEVHLYDGLGVCVGAFDDDMPFDDFLTICEDGEGEKEWREYLEENPGLDLSRGNFRMPHISGAHPLDASSLSSPRSSAERLLQWVRT